MSFQYKNVWGFYNPVRLTVGRGCRMRLVEELDGKSVLIVTTKRGRCQFLNDPLLSKLVLCSQLIWIDSVVENPELVDLQSKIDWVTKQPSYDAVIAFGGGSSLDAAKAINTTLAEKCQHHSLAMLLADLVLCSKIKPKPLYALPTTSGTGSEVTPFATVWDYTNKKKLSLVGEAVYPFAAFIDSELSDTVPQDTTISVGLDAINQAAESVWNKNATPITIEFAFRSLQLGFAALPALSHGANDKQARDKMAEASLLSGLAISHTRTALCHSISYPITLNFGVPHGLACAFTMPAVLRYNLMAEDGRFAMLANILTGTSDLKKLVKCFDDLHDLLHVRKRVRSFIPNINALLELEEQMFTQGRVANNLAEIKNLRPILIGVGGCQGEKS